MDVWIPITIAAAAAQTVRFMLQKHLKSTQLSTVGATFSRFVYSAPLIGVLIVIYARLSGQQMPELASRFWWFALSGGLAQILATLCVVELFTQRNFAVGVTFKKTEALQTGILGYFVLDDHMSRSGVAAIFLGLIGVVLLSDPPGPRTGKIWSRILNRGAGLGILSGILFAVSAVGYRGASLSLPGGDVIMRAGYTLAVVTASQTLAMGLWLVFKDRVQLIRVARAWRVAGLVGLTSMIGSFGWFTAFTLQNAAYVKTLGQIELIFSLAASVLFFREKISKREIMAMVMLLSSILMLVIFI